MRKSPRARPSVRTLGLALAFATATVGWAPPGAAGMGEPPKVQRTYLADDLLDDLAARVDGFVDGLLPPSMAPTVENLHLRDRGLEYRNPMRWKQRDVELRLQGGRFRGRATKGYGLQVEVRF